MSLACETGQNSVEAVTENNSWRQTGRSSKGLENVWCSDDEIPVELNLQVTP